MDTMIRTFFRHLLESIKSLKRNGWMTVASVSAVTITLTLVGVFMAVIMNATKLAQDIEGNVDVSVFVDIGTKDEEMKKLEKELNDLDHVKKVEFSSKEQELKKIQNEMGDSWKLFEGDNNPLYDVYVVSAIDPSYTKQVAEKAADLKNVSRSDYGGASSDRIFQIAGAVRTWGLVAAALLLFVAMFLISNTIRITILSRQREIQIMRLVGAKNGYIRWPFFLEGGWIGLIGAILPILIITFGYAWFYQLINPSLLRSHYSLIHPENIVWKINLLMVGIGVIIGSLGSIISMRRFLKF
ncbi:efflux ABC transporter permease [Enterococcus faecium EnGen0029]|nr:MULTISPECIES: permease-like cell division protein FtsX [Enterococcus]ELB05183.1 efflux ABC transporter permease [Enterococcus faecium EnGen0028]ELB08185.1 efflux ABC transporter permease [Enterococcus faecium EnGen0029]MDB7357975.1 permease-like cell division protein FtsX [Enterococcus faecium]MDB7376304.1 permease-like cell division protein FtsX [Enterococcus faecium]MDB7378706.1 permease-like cell division protein FtsX [Enterococcus faecium]